MKRFYYIASLLVIMVGLSACDHDWYQDDALLGRWTADYYYDGYDYFNVIGYDVDHFTFYRNGSGRYEYYDDHGRLAYTDFDWDYFGRDQIEISFYDGYGRSYLRYYYDYDRDGFLILSESPYFTTYTGYRFSY